MIANFSTEDILHEALAAPASAVIRLPDSRVIERPGWWQIITPSITSGGMNEVICGEVPHEGGDALIDETVATYRQLGLRFRWTVGPEGGASDLPEQLTRRGLRRRRVLVMARATGGAGVEDEALPTVAEVTLAGVDDCTQVMAEGWNTESAPLDALHRLMLAHPARRHRLFVARCDGAAAATAGDVALDRSAYLVGGVTLPRFRRRGLYQALVGARLRHAAERGLALATSVALADTSAPILTQMGFAVVAQAIVFVND